MLAIKPKSIARLPIWRAQIPALEAELEAALEVLVAVHKKVGMGSVERNDGEE